MKGPIKQKKGRKNRVRKRRVVGRIYGMKYSWKGHKDRNRHKNVYFDDSVDDDDDGRAEIE